MNVSFQKLFYAIATAFSVFAILILARSVLVPLAFALLISFILYPLVKRIESWGFNNILAVFCAMFAVIAIVGGGIYVFSSQLIELSTKFSNFQGKIIGLFADLTQFVNQNISFIDPLAPDDLMNLTTGWLKRSTGLLVKETVNSTASFFTGLLATITFTFLILIYRQGLTNALIAFSPEKHRARVLKMFQSVQKVGQKYLFGMFILIIVIGLANSIGLMIIGIENPFLFGFLGAILAIIPYAGTIAGALIPILYAFITYNSLGMAMAVAILFWAVQLVSDNFLNPVIVGNSININALTAILSLIIGAVVWGVAGMILFLPFAAMFKVICDEYEELKPIALLIESQNQQEDDGSMRFFSRCGGWLKKGFSQMAKSIFRK